MAHTSFNNTQIAEIDSFLGSKGLIVKSTWLDSFLPTVRSNTPLPALQKTALFRILTTDIAQTLRVTQSTSFPTTVLDATKKEQTIAHTLVVQVLDVEDIGRSRYSQLEALESFERGETMKGREIIRVVPNEDESIDRDNAAIPDGGGPHRLVLQDAAGTKVYGLEMASIDGVGLNMSIGSKICLRDAVVARGVVLLYPKSAEVLGGKVEMWDREWRKNRKKRLTEAIDAAGG